MDLSKAIEPKSDQLNASDLIAGPRTYTIERVAEGSEEQPVNIHLVELPKRPYRPSKTMLRMIVTAWGAETKTFAGRRLTLYRNPKVKWGGVEVGGIEISHMSHIGKQLREVLPTSKGKTAVFTVQPLPDVAPAQQQPDLSIPDDVVATTARAASEGKLPTYIVWLTEQGAPPHILDYAKAQEPTE
ncbi:hypothetical protein [Paenarthrobacter nitroguajacolicus]|uniref:hypothetical protein n=1 Tax=Paenarthrobacter nitroguajacolicus TaxID=211146 RepID=UPI0015BD48F9|nr:hypothetical protein [Paenarthrobacter nitroguajacolicus]NWL34464.1 hypothetical protein [Paenarthrobacter nitroguajacolicus]